MILLPNTQLLEDFLISNKCNFVKVDNYNFKVKINHCIKLLIKVCDNGSYDITSYYNRVELKTVKDLKDFSKLNYLLNLDWTTNGNLHYIKRFELRLPYKYRQNMTEATLYEYEQALADIGHTRSNLKVHDRYGLIKRIDWKLYASNDSIERDTVLSDPNYTINGEINIKCYAELDNLQELEDLIEKDSNDIRMRCRIILDNDINCFD